MGDGVALPMGVALADVGEGAAGGGVEAGDSPDAGTPVQPASTVIAEPVKLFV